MSLLISRVTLDDVMRCALQELLGRGEPVSPSKGDCRELRGVLLEITNPRARLSRSESRGQAFSCLGELCWYLSGANELEFIEYYIPNRLCTWLRFDQHAVGKGFCIGGEAEERAGKQRGGFCGG